MDACPPLEDIAAFLDGTLSSEERARITEHLAHCESCYEIFAGAAHFQEESAAEDTGRGGVLRFPFRGGDKERTSRGFPRWSLAASVLLVSGLGAFAWWNFLVPPKMVVANLIQQIPGREISEEDLYPYNRFRGQEDSSFATDRPSFLVGALLVDLRMSTASSDVKTSEDLLDLLGATLAEVDHMEEVAGQARLDAQKLKESPSYIRDLAARVREREAKLDESFLLPEFLAFGKWAEAGRLAAVTQTREFFETRKNRRFLSHLQKTLPSQLAPELQEPVLEDLEAIERIWDQGDLSKEDLRTLADHFERIIRRIDDYEEDLTGDE